jgi:segregation and condensation protein B
VTQLQDEAPPETGAEQGEAPPPAGPAVAERGRTRDAGGATGAAGPSTETLTLSLEQVRRVMESLLFAADRPLTVVQLVELLGDVQVELPAADDPLEPPPPSTATWPGEDGASAEVERANPEGLAADGQLPLATEVIEQPTGAVDEESPDGERSPLGAVLTAAVVRVALESIGGSLASRGFTLHEVAGGYVLRTHPDSAVWVQRLLGAKPTKLSRATMETLAIVAYRQPITRPEIDEIRGVDSGGTLKTLLEKALVRIVGKKEEAGRPLLYGTTKEFLTFFQLRDLRELPSLREFHELVTDETATSAQGALSTSSSSAGTDREPPPATVGSGGVRQPLADAEEPPGPQVNDLELERELTAAILAAEAASLPFRTITEPPPSGGSTPSSKS